MANDREQRRRFKARVRLRPNGPSPYFLDVKQRILDVIAKAGAPVPGDRWRQATDGDSSVGDVLPERGRADAFALSLAHHLEPVLLVEYEREAYVIELALPSAERPATARLSGAV